MSSNNSTVFEVRVTRIGEYPYFSFYTIEAANKFDAEREARKRFCVDFGPPYDQTKAYTLANTSISNS